MQNKLVPLLILATAATSGLWAQDAGVQTPASPAPVQAPAPATVQSAPVPNQVIYSPRLPTPAELSSIAAAQGLTIEQINQTATQVTVITRNSAGQTNTVAYQLLPTAPTTTITTVVAPTPAPTVVYQTQPVIYQAQPEVIYYDSPYYYRPRYYYPPVSLSFGFGYSHFSGGSHWHGGGHGWHR